MYEVRWGAFIAALFLAPLVLAVPAMAILFLMSLVESGLSPIFSFLFAPVFAVMAGAPTYLTLGTASGWYALRRIGPNAPFWAIGFGTNLISAPMVLLFFVWLNPEAALSSTAFVIGFGCIFAPIWGTIGGWLYRRFTKIGDGLQERAAAHSAATTRDIRHPHD